MDVPDREPKLEFSYDGDDLVIRTHVEANASAHVLWTHWVTQINDVVLCYHVVQNRDLFMRSHKWWRWSGASRGGSARTARTGSAPGSTPPASSCAS